MILALSASHDIYIYYVLALSVSHDTPKYTVCWAGVANVIMFFSAKNLFRAAGTCCVNFFTSTDAKS